jgi:hypothetical protein
MPQSWTALTILAAMSLGARLDAHLERRAT